MLAGLAMLVGAGSSSAHSAAAPPPVTFTDPSGDAGTAADIGTVKVSNDDTGQYTFAVAFATPYGDSALFGLYFDTDLNASTGDPQEVGADYLLYDDHAAHAFSLLKWNGTDWEDAPTDLKTVSVSIATDRSGLTMTINRSELGDTNSFNFFAFSVDGDGSAGHFDDAPSGTGTWQYTFQKALTLSLASAVAGQATAGKTWALAVVVNRSDTGANLGAEGAIVCSGSSGSTKLVASVHAFISGGSGKGAAAVCAFNLPKSLKKKTVSGTVTVSFGGVTVKHVFTAHVK